MLKFVSGNILESECYALVNTVNTVGVMGKGIALQFKREFPYNYDVYRRICLSHNLEIGKLLPVKDSSLLLGQRLIINFPTKTHWRLPSEYAYIEQGLRALSEYITTEKLSAIAIPALGCGNGGLDWQIVRPLIIKYLSVLNCVIEIYPPAH